ncbi:MAG: tetratricopeptide repeat protein, partial [Pseudomonadales bacterium]|nr:tetratricopeptide repeat protein [Pseudomonadales bacterium]
LGQLECRLGDHNAAVFHLRRAARLAPGRPDIHLGLGNALNNAGENRAAVRSYLDAVRADPAFAPGYVSLGKVLVQNGQHEKALRVLERARQLDPSYPQVHYELGVFFKAQGRIEPAIAALLNCIRLDGDFESAHFEIAGLFILQGAYADALDHLHCHAQKHPADANAWVAQAIAYLGIDKLDEAAESVEHALQLNPAHSMALTQLGRICLARADRPGAQRAYNAALAANHSNALAHVGQAEVYALQGQQKAAVKHMSGAGDPRHHDLPTLQAYCRVLQSLNRTGHAIGLLVKRLARRCDSAAGRSSCHFLVGDLYAARGEFAEAFRHYQNANALQIKNFDGDAFEERLKRSLSFF